MTAGRAWIVYTRVSTEDQTTGASLDMQRQQCLAMAQATGSEPVEVIVDDGYSAKDLARPGMRRILATLDAGRLAGVIVWRLDRLTRSLKDLISLTERFQAGGAGLMSLHERIDTSGPMGRFTLHLMGALAQLERETIATRVKASMDHIRGKGGWVGGTVPTGCRRAGVRGDYRLEADPGTAPLVREAFAAYIAGASLDETAARLAAVGATRRKLTPTNISNLIHNDFIIAAGVVPADLAAEARAACAARVVRRGSTMPVCRSAARVWPLHGLATCAQCGCALVGVMAHGRGKAYPYLRCAGRARRQCKATDLPAATWERAVIDAVQAASADGRMAKAWADHAAAMAEAHRGADARRTAILADLGQTKARMGRLLTALETAAGATPEVQARLAELGAQARRLESEAAALDAAHQAVEVIEAQRAALADEARRAVAALPSAQPEQIGDILRAIVSRVVIDGRAPAMWLRLHYEKENPTRFRVGPEQPGGGAGSASTPEWLSGREACRTGDIRIGLEYGRAGVRRSLSEVGSPRC